MLVDIQREADAPDRIEWVIGGAGNVDDDLVAHGQ
jgi:hypothetical protein